MTKTYSKSLHHNHCLRTVSRGLGILHNRHTFTLDSGVIPSTTVFTLHLIYRKGSKFWDARKLCCNLPKIQIKRPNRRVFRQKNANGIANSEDPDRGAV